MECLHESSWKRRGRLDSVAVLPDGSPLNVGLVWRLARRVMAHLAGTRESEDVDVEVWLDNPPGLNDASTRTTPTTSSVHGGTSKANVKEKVLKMSSLVDQADDSELLPPSNSELNEVEEPLPNQLAALFKRVFANDRPPYCDFGVWLPVQRKMSKANLFRV